jgi:hypothetical protein
MQRSALSVAFVAAALAAAAAPAGAQDQAGLAFRDARPLTLAPEALGTSAAADQLTVCNGGAEAATKLRASAGGFGFKDGDGDALADDAVLSAPVIRHTTLAPGSCMRVRLATTGATALGSGSFTGTVAVSSAGQGVAHRELTLTGPPDVAVAPKAVVDTVKVKITHWAGPLHFLFGDDHDVGVPLQGPPPGKDLKLAGACQDGDATPSTSCPAIGVAAHDDETGQFSLGGPAGEEDHGVVALPVHLHGAARVGDYTGTIDPGQTFEDDDAIKVVVSVTQAWPWALLALLIGCALAIGPQWWTRRTRPASKVRDRAGGLAERYAEAVQEFHGAEEPKRFPEIRGPSAACVEEYAGGVVVALDRYLRSMVFLDTSTDTYKAIETSLKTADDDIDCLQTPTELLASLGLLRKDLADLLRWLADHQFCEREPALAREAAKVLADQDLQVGAALKLKAGADTAVATLAAWRELAERLLRSQLWWRAMAIHAALRPMAGGMDDEDAKRHVALGARLAQTKAELLKVEDAGELEALGVKARLEKLYDELGYLGGRYGVEEPDVDGLFIELRDYWAEMGPPPSMKAMLMLPLPRQAITSVVALISGADAPVHRPARPAVVAKSWRWVGDAVCIALALVVALLSAMVAIVSGKNFGTLSDWLTVALIGTAAQGIVSGVIPAINGALQDRFGSVLVAEAEPSSTADGEAAKLPPPPPPPGDPQALPVAAA